MDFDCRKDSRISIIVLSLSCCVCTACFINMKALERERGRERESEGERGREREREKETDLALKNMSVFAAGTDPGSVSNVTPGDDSVTGSGAGERRVSDGALGHYGSTRLTTYRARSTLKILFTCFISVLSSFVW